MVNLTSQLGKHEFSYVFAINALINQQNFVVDEFCGHIYFINSVHNRVRYYIFHNILGINFASLRTKNTAQLHHTQLLNHVCYNQLLE